MPELPIDHDALFKELLSTLFFEFLELFAPQIAQAIDRDHTELLDKELLSDLVPGDDNVVDLLAKVKIAGEATFVLIHIETQSSSRGGFAERMFDYFTRIRARFSLRVYPMALFSFEAPRREEPDRYAETTFGLEVVRFRFQSIQLNRLNWRDYVQSSNPIATALMVKMQMGQEDRVKVRLACLRLFVTLKLDGRKQQTIDRFVRSYLGLNAEETRELRREIETTMPKAEQQQYLSVMNEWEALGMERGIEQGIERGIEQGLREGEARMALRQLRRKLGELEEGLRQQIVSLSTAGLEDLGEALLGFETVDDLRRWLGEHGPSTA